MLHEYLIYFIAVAYGHRPTMYDTLVKLVHPRPYACTVSIPNSWD